MFVWMSVSAFGRDSSGVGFALWLSPESVPSSPPRWGISSRVVLTEIFAVSAFLTISPLAPSQVQHAFFFAYRSVFPTFSHPGRIAFSPPKPPGPTFPYSKPSFRSPPPRELIAALAAFSVRRWMPRKNDQRRASFSPPEIFAISGFFALKQLVGEIFLVPRKWAHFQETPPSFPPLFP